MKEGYGSLAKKPESKNYGAQDGNARKNPGSLFFL